MSYIVSEDNNMAFQLKNIYGSTMLVNVNLLTAQISMKLDIVF